MIKQLLCTLAAAMLAAGPVMAQTGDAGEPPVKKEKKMTHQVGLQMNELVRQVFNFGNNSAPAITNPYLLTYAMNSRRSGWGFRIGVGYNFRSFTDDDGVTTRETENNNLNARLGVDKAFFLSGKWSAGIGLDAVYANEDNFTRSSVRSFDTTTTEVRSLNTNYGGGPMGWLRYHVTDKVLVGTEASFYYRVGNEKQDITITKRDLSKPARPYVTTTSHIDADNSEGIFALPVVLYLIVRF